MKGFELQEGINTGVLIAPPQPGDYIAGAISAINYRERITDGQWVSHRPSVELQHSVYFDTMACVSFSAANSIEIQVNWLIKTGQVSVGDMQRLHELGFIDENGHFNCSDRFIAKMSGTTRQGNWMNVVWETIRKYGLLPEKDWPYPREQRTPVFDWDDYYKEIPQDLKDKALKILDILQFAYEWIGTDEASIKKHLKQAPIQIAAKVCSPWNTTNIIQSCGVGSQHATIIDGYGDVYWHDFDHYNPAGKKLAIDYGIAAALKGIVELKTVKLIDKVNMVMIKKIGESAVYAQVGDTLIPFFTTWEEYLAEYASAKIVELSAAEFAKYKVVATLGIKKK